MKATHGKMQATFCSLRCVFLLCRSGQQDHRYFSPQLNSGDWSFSCDPDQSLDNSKADSTGPLAGTGIWFWCGYNPNHGRQYLDLRYSHPLWSRDEQRVWQRTVDRLRINSILRPDMTWPLLFQPTAGLFLPAADAPPSEFPNLNDSCSIRLGDLRWGRTNTVKRPGFAYAPTPATCFELGACDSDLASHLWAGDD